MSRRLIYLLSITAGALILAAVALWLPQASAQAQCGSQASSCKNCHEVQGKDPVNADGTGWHQSHAFGDFCYICHGGNSQATDETAAHQGMVAPMSDIQAACAQCHPNDLQARADVYAVKLGVQAGVPAAASQPIPAPSQPTSTAAAIAQSAPPPSAPLAANDPNLTDYVARYNQQVLHQQPTNWGNLIFAALGILLVLGGLLFINRREGWISISFSEKKAIDKEYPADVAAVADLAAKLSPNTRKSLMRLLAKPSAISNLLPALEKFSTDVTSEEKQ
jgi:hypothetical protein